MPISSSELLALPSPPKRHKIQKYFAPPNMQAKSPWWIPSMTSSQASPASTAKINCRNIHPTQGSGWKPRLPINTIVRRGESQRSPWLLALALRRHSNPTRHQQPRRSGRWCRPSSLDLQHTLASTCNPNLTQILLILVDIVPVRLPWDESRVEIRWHPLDPTGGTNCQGNYTGIPVAVPPATRRRQQGRKHGQAEEDNNGISLVFINITIKPKGLSRFIVPPMITSSMAKGHRASRQTKAMTRRVGQHSGKGRTWSGVLL